jgi:hypothetical protein
LQHHVVWWKFTNISEVLAASIIRAITKPQPHQKEGKKRKRLKELALIRTPREPMGSSLDIWKRMCI